MKAYVAVTDGRWAQFLAERPELVEVNFWRPSTSRNFRVLAVGEPFFFKSRAPHNHVIGGGFYSGFARLSIAEAWEVYQEGNGAPDLAAMRAAISAYRTDPIADDEDPVIGCVLLRDVRFFAPGEEVPAPPDFARNLVQGRGYDLAEYTHTDYFDKLMVRLVGQDVRVDASTPWHREGPIYSDPAPVRRRLGQQAFKAVVLDAYERRCAVTGSVIRPVLEAAHIRPVAQGGEHRLDNGLLLRSDIHTLFDRGYLGIDHDHRLLVSSRIREEFGDGDEFYGLACRRIGLPESRAARPAREMLAWHRENVFRG